MGHKTKRKRVSRSWYGDLLVTLMLLLVGLFMVIPMVFSVSNAFKPLDELFIFPPKLFPRNPTIENFRILFQLTSSLWVPFSRYIFNSTFVSLVVTGTHILVASMAAYPLSKHHFPGKNVIFQIILLALLFNGTTLAIPQYIILAKLGMIDTYWAAVLPPIASSLGLFLMRQFMVQIVNDSVLESARIDGAGELTIYWKIVMPMVKPAWLTLLILAFQNIWNTTDANVIYSESLKMLPLALNQIQQGGIARTGVHGAAVLVMMIPPILTFIITQSNVIETMAHSGMKD